MVRGKYVSYLRVSTQRQGRSMLGIEAQRAAVKDYLNGGKWELVEEVVEVESGKTRERPQLQRALASCRIHGAILLVAKLDRLSRDAFFLFGLRDSGVEFVATDMPSASRLTVNIMAVVAEEEGRMISARTKAALAAAKARGTKLGNPKNLTNRARREGNIASAISRREAGSRWMADVAPIVRTLVESEGLSLRQAAARLNRRSLPARRGGDWSAAQVLRVLREERRA